MPNPNELERIARELAAAGEPDFTPTSDVLEINFYWGDQESHLMLDSAMIEQAVDPAGLLTAVFAPILHEMLLRRKSK